MRLNGTEHRIYTGYAETDCGEYYPDCYSVDAKSVCQYTGLTDKNGTKIFDGDIVTHTQLYEISGTVISVGVVKRSDSYGGYLISGFTNGRIDMFLATELHRIKVVGNIHDNPELLKALNGIE